MGTTATSLKLPADLKERLQEIAERSGQSPHAYMLVALQERVQQDEQAQRFLAEARAADRAMRRSGTGYAAAEVHDYIERRLAGKGAKRPGAKRWRA
jgi:predicted transcriptional regulator